MKGTSTRFLTAVVCIFKGNAWIGQLQANGMTFECGTSGNEGSNGDVMFIHGNEKHNKERFYPLMTHMGDHGYRTVACDMRGFSPRASPQQAEAYNYNELAKDIFAIADAAGFGHQFHVVAHDQGARLMWHTIAASEGRSRFLSVSSLAIPHGDAFSESVVGPTANPIQQSGYQYMDVFVMDTPESLEWSRNQMYEYHAESLDKIQRRTWWYKGGVDAGALGLPPKEYDAQFPWTTDGVPSTAKVGHVDMPVLYICGDHELCGRAGGFPFASRTGELCDGAYTHLRLPTCGHNIMESCQSAHGTCTGSACGLYSGSGYQVWDTIIGNIQLAQPPQPTQPTQPPQSSSYNFEANLDCGQCGDSNYLYIGAGGNYWDDATRATALAVCGPVCDAHVECGGFNFEESLGNCYYRRDTGCSRSTNAARDCFTKVNSHTQVVV